MGNTKEEIMKKINEAANLMDIDIVPDEELYTAVWFNEKSKNFPTLDKDAEEFRTNFITKFSPDVLANLKGKELLNYIFLNNENKTNLCHTLEFDSKCKYLFGSIKGGFSSKFGLYYSKKNSSWIDSSNAANVNISEEEAIKLGTHIRDCLLNGYTTIKEIENLASVDDYSKLYNELLKTTDGYIDRAWFVKYYAMLFPDYFIPIYTRSAQYIVIDKLNLRVEDDNKISRIGVIREFVKKCEISNIVFSKIFWTFCNKEDEEDETEENEEENNFTDIFNINRKKIVGNKFPLNLIVYGAPGTSKTYNMPNYAVAIIEGKEIKDVEKDREKLIDKYQNYAKNGRIVFTTFHQNYGYEDFIQGLRPNTNTENLSFRTVDGTFKKIADKAMRDGDNPYVIIIDEINRGNISKIFGELITLIEEDKRWGEENQMYSKLLLGEDFAVPNNLYIIGTMNSADKSISLIDAALRRRFAFEEMIPNPELITDNELKKIFIKLNDILKPELDSTDLLIGHSYFIDKKIDDLVEIFNRNIIPLLYEYCFDNRKRVEMILENTLANTNFEIENVEYGRLRIKKKN